MSNTETIYRILFHHQNQSFELYARQIYQSELGGFVEIEDLIFQTDANSLLVDPSVEKLKNEFAQTKRSFIPIYNIIRIDEVDKVGVSKIKLVDKDTPRITPFPSFSKPPKND